MKQMDFRDLAKKETKKQDNTNNYSKPSSRGIITLPRVIIFLIVLFTLTILTVLGIFGNEIALNILFSLISLVIIAIVILIIIGIYFFITDVFL